jgi:hypothetical protein
MAADPFGAHQVGVNIADHMAYRYATDHDVLGVPVDEATIDPPHRHALSSPTASSNG